MEKVIKRPYERVRQQTIPKGESLTRQSEAAACNIHNIMARFKKTGMLPIVDRQPLSGHLPDIGDYHNAMNILAETRSQFNALPVDLRQEFDNDPAKFVEFCTNPDNLETMREMGLAKPAPVAPTPPQQPPVSNGGVAGGVGGEGAEPTTAPA